MSNINKKCLQEAIWNLELLETLINSHSKVLDMSTDPTTTKEDVLSQIGQDIYEMEDPYSRLPLAEVVETELQQIESNFLSAPYGRPLEEGYSKLIHDIFIPLMLESFATCQCPKPVKPNKLLK